MSRIAADLVVENTAEVLTMARDGLSGPRRGADLQEIGRIECGAVASHALARAALHDGKKPLLMGDDNRLAETDCGDVYPELAARLATPLVSELAEGAAPDPAEEQEGSSSPIS